jgi:hypothetical protein
MHSLKLDNIMNEIIPLHQWHFSTADEHITPVLNDLLDYQRRACLAAMTANRDQRWTTTALSFASSTHPPKDKSYWAAARRTLIVFYWVGHDRNKSKKCALYPAPKAQVEKCPHFHKIDGQAHCMRDCIIRPSLLCAKLREPNKLSSLTS